jgi:DNA processing protein
LIPVIDQAEFAAWFRLLEAPGVGRGTARTLLAHFGSPDAVLSASQAALRNVVDGPTATALAQPTDEVQARLSAAQAWRQGAGDRCVVVLGSAAYPTWLLQTADPPLLLYVHGDASALTQPSIAVVGSRNPTAQGSDNARAFARHLGDAGLTVVSGLALGIDGAAHEGALASRSPTVAVVGTGLDIDYPARHSTLGQRIVAQGAIVSEFAPGTPPLASNFPLRNRIIAGLTRGTLVVEAALRSGSLITARLATEAGREVFAIPGSIHSPQSRGCHALIKQGAKLVESANDILEELNFGSTGNEPALRNTVSTDDSAVSADPLLRALGNDPMTMDALGARTGWPQAQLAARLLELELAGHVARLPGGLIQRRHSA